MVLAPLSVSRRDDGVMAVSGELDCSTATVLIAALGRTAPPVRVDLGELAFIDSAGLHALVTEQQRWGSQFAIVAASDVVRRVCAIAGLTATLLLPPPPMTLVRAPD